MLEVNNIEVVYNKVILVLKGLSLQLKNGQIVALLGANGAGKSTVLKAISGLLTTALGEVTDGDIEFENQRIDQLGPEKIVKLGIIQVMEGGELFKHLTVEENIKVGGYSRTNSAEVRKDLESAYRYFPRLLAMRNRLGGFLSGGERQMLVLARSLMSKPKLMLLDEPSLGLSPIMVKDIFKIIRQINLNERTSILLVEQNVSKALKISEYGYVMENGKIVMDGESEKLGANEDIKEFYLGLSDLGVKRSYRDVKHYRRRKRWLG